MISSHGIGVNRLSEGGSRERLALAVRVLCAAAGRSPDAKAL